MKLKLKKNWLYFTVNILLGLMCWHFLSDLIAGQSPDKMLTRTGEMTLWLLILTIACTPIARTFKIKHYRRYRKAFGIFSFLYVLLHVAAFLTKSRWNLSETAISLFSEWNLILAFLSFLIMIPLGLTSNRFSLRLLKKRWNSLHRSTYLLVILAFGHVLFLTDSYQPDKLAYGVVIALLLILRLPVVSNLFHPTAKAGRSQIKSIKSSNGLSKSGNALLMIIAGSITMVSFINGNAEADTGQPYTYDPNHGVFSTLFMASEMPIVKNGKTRQLCGVQCHWTFQPGLLPQSSWERIMNQLQDHFGETINLSPDEKEEISRYLMQNSADHTASRVAVNILDSLKGTTPGSMDSIPYLKKKHSDIDAGMFQHESVVRFSNCPACHIGVEQSGSYKEKHVSLPEGL
ncbi:ferric reductase-like transmembrane domain-containing protein [bacterium]|nr:ferric reductase-like transmembrane domain-containing protein [bacterium]